MTHPQRCIHDEVCVMISSDASLGECYRITCPKYCDTHTPAAPAPALTEDMLFELLDVTNDKGTLDRIQEWICSLPSCVEYDAAISKAAREQVLDALLEYVQNLPCLNEECCRTVIRKKLESLRGGA